MTENDETKTRIVVAMDFSEELMEQMQEAAPNFVVEQHFPDVPDSVWTDTEILYSMRHFPMPEQAPRLRWVQLHSAGMDFLLKHPLVQAEDVDITSASGIHAVNMAEYTLAMMLAFMYKIPTMLRYQVNGKWPDQPYAIYEPHGLRGKTVGIVGYGSVGRELARIATTMGMTILASKRDVMRSTVDEGYAEPGIGDPEGILPERLYPGEAIASMAKECDFLVILLPLTEQTRHIINEDVLLAMKPSAVLINVARGSVVDEAALISALAAGQIAGAALDVFEEEPLPSTSPLWNMDNVIISPHVSGNTSLYHRKAVTLFIENLERYTNKRPLLNVLNRETGY